MPYYTWHAFFSSGTGGDKAFTAAWSARAGRIELPNPMTDYERHGEAWRFPGQLEFGSFSEEVRASLSELLLRMLRHKDKDLLVFQVGRFSATP